MPGDHPICGRGEDALGRAPFADGLAELVRSADASRGVVFAVLGPWGAGKSSVLNIFAESLTENPALVTVKFDPWLFSGTVRRRRDRRVRGAAPDLRPVRAFGDHQSVRERGPVSTQALLADAAG